VQAAAAKAEAKEAILCPKGALDESEKQVFFFM